MSEKKTPILVALIGVLALIGGIISLVIGIIGLIPSLEDFVIDMLPDFPLASLQAVAIMSVVIGAIFILIGIGFLKGWSIFWYLGVVFSVLALIMEAYSIYQGMYPTIPVIIINLIILLYLFSPKVKTYFLE